MRPRHQHLLAVLRPEPQARAAGAAEHGAAHLGLLVLQGEIDVAGGWPGQVGDFAGDPQRRKTLSPAAAAPRGSPANGVDGLAGGLFHCQWQFTVPGRLRTITRFPPPLPARSRHAHSRGSTHLRRRPAAARLLGRAAPGREPCDAADPRDHAEHPAGVRRHGHGHRSAPRHRHGAGRRHRHDPQEHEPRRAGAPGGAGEEIRERHGQGPDHGVPRNDHPRGNGHDPRQQHLRHAGGGQGPDGRHRHQPRPALRDAPR